MASPLSNAGETLVASNANGETANTKGVPLSDDLVAAAGFNLQNPIMNALMGNIKGTLPTKKGGVANSVRCDVCECEMSSDTVLSFHINGAKHKKKMKALEIVAQLKEKGEQGLELGKEDDPNAFRCEVCSLTVNSAQQLEIHVAGAKHKNKVAKAGLAPPTVSIATGPVAVAVSGTTKQQAPSTETDGPPLKKKKKEEPKMLNCDICNVMLNSQQQYDQHLVSKKHMNKVNPPAPLHKKKENRDKRNFQFGGFPNKGRPNFHSPRFPNPEFNDANCNPSFGGFDQFNPQMNRNRQFNNFDSFDNRNNRNNNFDNRPNLFEKRNNPFDNRNKPFINKNNGFGNKNNAFGNKNNAFGNKNNGFENRNNAFDNRNNAFDNRNNSFEKRNNPFDNQNNGNFNRNNFNKNGGSFNPNFGNARNNPQHNDHNRSQGSNFQGANSRKNNEGMSRPNSQYGGFQALVNPSMQFSKNVAHNFSLPPPPPPSN